VKILFFMRHPGAVRNHESALRLLAERGHQIHVAFERAGNASSTELVESLAEQYPSFSHGPAPERGDDGWAALARKLRLSIDYLRYLAPPYGCAPKLQERAELRAPGIVRRLARWPLVRSPFGLRVFGRVLRLFERATPNRPEVEAFIREQQPDLVLVTPLLELGSPQADYIRAARALGVRSGLCVHSWDNLTNKGLIQHTPDVVTVWNEALKRETVELHDVPASKVIVTGASTFDHWFAWAPSTTRSEFCEQVGLTADRPFLLYLCSSPFVAPDEVGPVEHWVRQLRTSGDGRLRDVGVLIRPHPQNARQWRDVELSDLDDVVVWPRAGADPVDGRAKADYYDSIYHCAAVIGVNTSALIEGAIVGRPVYTLLAPEFRDTQEGTLHFHHLLEANGGPLHVAGSFEEHAAQLAVALTPEGQDGESNRRFLEVFVRPHGLDMPATVKLVAALEEVFAAPPARPQPRPLWASLLQPLLAPVADRVNRQQAQERYERRLRQKKEREIRQARQRERERIRRQKKELAKARKKEEAKQQKKEEARRRKEELERRYQARQQKPGRPPDAVLEAAGVVAELAAKADTPIIVGPWFGEVGFELLYWIPFLTWATANEPGLADRLIVVSRGGVSHWYNGISCRYVDLFDYLSPDEFRDREDGMAKPTGLSTFERGIIDRVRQTLALPDVDILHPAVIYEAIRRLRTEETASRIQLMSLYRPMESPPPGPLDGALPDEYVAIRFYFNKSFPETEENLDFIRSMIRSLTDKTNVVLLNPGLRFDDHWDFEAIPSERVFRVDHLMVPANNLAIQTAVISRARAFVGTYGGLSYLAPFFGLPSLSFYSDPEEFVWAHLELAQRAFRGPGLGQFVTLDTKQVDLIQLASDTSLRMAWANQMTDWPQRSRGVA
jgi:hypothetical protein